MPTTNGLPLEWTLPSKVVPFPLVRRRELVFRAARAMLLRGHQLESTDPIATGEKMLAATLKRQREVMEKRGIHPEKIAMELEGLERAIRFECARLLAMGAVA